MKKLSALVLVLGISGCLGVRHGNPMKRGVAPVTSDVAAIESSSVSPVQTKTPALDEPESDLPGGDYY